jgi:hypothetical protein
VGDKLVKDELVGLEIYTEFWWGNVKEGGHMEGLVTNKWVLLIQIVQK